MHKEAQTETLQNLNLSIDNYVKDNLSICREERQYALYLSNVLRYMVRIRVESLPIGLEMMQK